MKWMRFKNIAGVKRSSKPELSHSRNKNSYQPISKRKKEENVPFCRICIIFNRHSLPGFFCNRFY
jgi:hypothetical protein